MHIVIKILALGTYFKDEVRAEYNKVKAKRLYEENERTIIYDKIMLEEKREVKNS